MQTDNPENEVLRRAFGKRLRQLRGQNVTQEQFAKKLGIIQSTLSRLEKGYTDPSLHVLAKLSELTGKSIDELVKGSEKKMNQQLNT